MTKYIERPKARQRVDAVQWHTGEFHPRVMGAYPNMLCGCVVLHGAAAGQPHVHITSNDVFGYTSVKDGDWIVDLGNGQVRIMHEDEFHRTYHQTSPLDALQTSPELLELLRAAIDNPMTPEEVREQKISWCWGMLSSDSTTSKEEVEYNLVKAGLIAPRK